VRRFRCARAACPVLAFTEQVPGVTQRHQRRTLVLRGLLERVALAPAGRAGARLAGVLGAVVSRFTLIRLIRACPTRRSGRSLSSALMTSPSAGGIRMRPSCWTWTITGPSTCCPTGRPAPSPTG
jgi:hypothetical protein